MVKDNPSSDEYFLLLSILTLLNFDQDTLQVSYFCPFPGGIENIECFMQLSLTDIIYKKKNENKL